MPLTNRFDNIIVSIGSRLASLRRYGGTLFLHAIIMRYPGGYSSCNSHHYDRFKDPPQLTTLRAPNIFFVTHGSPGRKGLRLDVPSLCFSTVCCGNVQATIKRRV